MKYQYDLIQDGLCVASVIAPKKSDAFKDIQHYALIYSQDGPVEIKDRSRKRVSKEKSNV